MKYYLITILIIFIFANVFASDQYKNEFEILDSLLLDASKNESGIEPLIEYIDSLSNKNEFNRLPLLLSYKGIAEALKGKYAFWPFTKSFHLNYGLQLMNIAVNKDSNNVKIRYMRFTVLNGLPDIVGYSSLAKKEAEKLFTQLVELNNSRTELYKKIASSLVDSERLSAKEKDTLVKLYNVERK